MVKSNQIELGSECEDTITGFKGVVVAATVFMQGCRRLMVQPQTLFEGKPIEAMYFDEPQLKVLRTPAQMKVKEGSKKTGGPHGLDHPSRISSRR